MKRAVCLILVSVMALLLAASAFAAGPYDGEPTFDDCLYVDKFRERYGSAHNHGSPYKELEIHYAEDDPEQPLWALVNVSLDAAPAYPDTYTILCIDRFLVVGAVSRPFLSEYCIYDVINDEWIEIDKALERGYEGLAEACNRHRIGTLYGDMDSDYKITILDVTHIQRYLVGLERGQKLAADYDRDGTATIIDATAIQRSLADLG